MQLICADWTGIRNFMKTFEKTWSAQYRDMEISVRNFWNLKRTGAEVYINGRRVYHNEAGMASASLRSLMGEYLEFEESGTKITVEIGSAWHFNETIRNINTHLRGTKLPGSNWRVQDKGHFHLWKR